jgi:IS30 family transposase
MDKRYKHLNGEERGVILAEHRRGASLGAIGALLGRSASTIGRELRRGRPEGDPAQPYCAQLGGDRYRVLRKRCGRRLKLVAGGWLHDFVRGKLIHKRWSPEQIACRLKSMHPDDPTRLISHALTGRVSQSDIPRGGQSVPRFTRSRRAG